MTTSNSKLRYVIGIDLGTSNSSLAYVDLLDSEKKVLSLEIPQWQDEGSLYKNKLLPSCAFIPTKKQVRDRTFYYEWDSAESLVAEKDNRPLLTTGAFAVEELTRTPARVISSAKSWLCHGGVDRSEKILPWHSDEIIGSSRYSPIEASAAILSHFKNAWNAEIAAYSEAYKMENQLVVITIPASFDEGAQYLTIEAAKLCGLEPFNISLLEEPQAAFYHLIDHDSKNTGDNRELASFAAEQAKSVLVCDIGGGTSDFSIIEVKASGQEKIPTMKRIDVSDHLLIGGDNIDLAIASLLEQRIFGPNQDENLSGEAWASLVAQAKTIKEKVLSENPTPETEFKASIVGQGSSLFSNLRTGAVLASEVLEIVMSGFFPQCSADALAETDHGLKEWGLPYPKDTRITHHIAEFLNGRKIDAILFNGGSMIPEILRTRLKEIISSWQETHVKDFQNSDLDLAVAKGAAFFNLSRYENSQLIEGGYARSLFIEVADESGRPTYLCVLPKGTQVSESGLSLSKTLRLRIGEPVRFQLFYSNQIEIAMGELLDDGTKVKPLPPLEAKLEMEKGKVGFCDVALNVHFGETGLFELSLLGKEPHDSYKWDLQLKVKEAPYSLNEGTATSAALSIKSSKKLMGFVKREVDAFYGKKFQKDIEGAPTGIAKKIEEFCDVPRNEWDGKFLRSTVDLLMIGKNRRGRSIQHEQAWLNMTGFCLRPGYGDPGDSFRVADIWSVYNDGMQFADELRVSNQWWIFWRRIAGGLDKEQQTKIFNKVFPRIRKGEASLAEVHLMLGSFERVDMELKIRYVQAVQDSILREQRDSLQQKIWAISRIASRVPLYGGAECIVRPRVVETWLETFLPLDCNKGVMQGLLFFFSQAARKIGDRELDVSERHRNMVLEKLAKSGAKEELIEVVRDLKEIDEKGRNQLFGEQLPVGLRLT